MRYRAVLAASLLVALVRHSGLAAQSPPQRALLRDALQALSGDSASREQPRCADPDAMIERLCAGLIQARRAEGSADKQAAVQSRDLLERVVTERPTWPLAWYGLGLARIQIARAGVVARPGPLHPIGVSNEAGAANAFVRALELDSSLVEAANALALMSLPREGASRLAERHAMLQRRMPALSATGRFGAALVALEVGDGRAVIRYLAPLAERGGPGGVHLALARGYYQAGEPDLGRAALLAGAADTGAAGIAAYRRELTLIAEPGELVTWDSLPPAARPAFLAAFWAERDVRGGVADGARLVEHYQRVEYVWAQFRRRVPQVGLQRNAGVAMTTDYGADELMIRFAGEYMSGDDPAVVAEIMRLDSDTKLLGVAGAFRGLRSSQEMIDDRGLIWLRHGKPDKVARTSDGLALEVWRYERPEGALVLQFREENFDGQVGASVLVPSLITANPLQRDQLCHLEQSLCTTNADPSGSVLMMGGSQKNNPGFGRLVGDAKVNTTARVARYRSLGLETIAEATTTDAYARRFPRAITPVVQLYGLVRLPDGGGRAVVAFAVPGAELAYTTPPEAAGRAVYPLRLEILLARRGDGTRAELDTLRRFATAAPLREGQYLTGVVELPVAPGEYVASVVLSQEDRGAIARMQAVAVPSAEGKLRISDVVLGREGSGARWQSGTQSVPLNPLNSYPKGGEAELYYQVAGLTAGSSFKTRVELFDADAPPEGKPRLVISFDASSATTRSEVTRTLGLSSLLPGRYRLRVTLAQGDASTSALSWLKIEK